MIQIAVRLMWQQHGQTPLAASEPGLSGKNRKNYEKQHRGECRRQSQCEQSVNNQESGRHSTKQPAYRGAGEHYRR
ncbi:MAG TPA: hypothetical protein VMP01_26970 [Pirellulaceae bacterium]|nr:hypothetical protein [Pirellulaceae bacterium]